MEPPANAAWERTERLLGSAAIKRLATARVAVFGIGGVGSYAVEALTRSGIGHLLLVDADTITLSNLNRQLHATHQTIGLPKVTVMAQRVKTINPHATVDTRQLFYLPENAASIELHTFDYIIDAIDTITAKVELISRAVANSIPIISCMGAGNKLDPTRFKINDIFATTTCPLCRVMRKLLRARKINHLQVVWSDEPPLTPPTSATPDTSPGSLPFVPPVAGLIAASAVIRHLTSPYVG
ncbi:MAG: tRNA threonylcarbamoyladenosine dehydratase [Lentisphaerae bacterium]|nr:tRNA threonylcarbamoyladenosine dehydratase [Lentisphaerota bacterium]